MSEPKPTPGPWRTDSVSPFDSDIALRLASPAELREMVQTLTRERDEAVADRRLAWDRLDRIRAALDDAGAPDGDGLDQRIGTLAAQRDEARQSDDAWGLLDRWAVILDDLIDKAGISYDPAGGREEAAEKLAAQFASLRADAARLRKLIESTAEGLDRITACGEALRQGGPVPEDLDELSDGLHNAVTEAGGLVDEIRAALAGEGEVESLIPVDVDLLGLRLRATHPSPDDVGEAGSYQIMRLRTRRGEPILIDCGAGREIKITVRPSAGGATPENARQA